MSLRAAVSTTAPEADLESLDLEGEFGAGSAKGNDVLRADIAAICRAFGRLTGDATCVVSMSLLRRQLCTKLHVDHVPLRVMVTYFGAGTECLDDATSLTVSRTMAAGVHFASDAIKSAAGYLKPPYQTGECDIVLLKGEKWVGNEGRGVVHRSPMVDACCGEWRLCLRIDSPDFVNPMEGGNDLILD